MPIPQKLTKAEFDTLPDATRDFYQTNSVYVPDGENWKLDAGIEDVSGLKSALKKEREEAANAKKLLAAEQEKLKGVDLEEYNRLKAEAESKENDELKSKGKIDELLEKKQTEIASIKKDYDAKLLAKDQELTIYIDQRLRSSFEKGGVIPDRIDDAVALTKPFAKRNEKGDLILLDKDGETPLDASVEIYAKELLKEQKPWLYAASGAGGSGASPGTSGSLLKGVDLSKLSPTERLKAANRVEAK